MQLRDLASPGTSRNASREGTPVAQGALAMRTTVTFRDSLEIQPGAYEMKGTYGHIQYHRGEDPDRRIYGIPVKVTWSNQVQYRCSFVLEVGRELRPGVWIVSFRGGTFELSMGDDGAMQGEASFPDGTAGTIYIGREMGFGKRPVLVAAKSLPDVEGRYMSKTFAGEVTLRKSMQAEILKPRLDPDDPDMTMRSGSAA